MSILAQMIGNAFGSEPTGLCSSDDIRLPAPRRRKLWELPHHTHCTLIGTCLPVSDMRKLAGRVGLCTQDMADYSLHTVVVGQCERRSELAELIQRRLDKRHTSTIQRFNRATDGAAVLLAWREVMTRGEDIAGALWAAWTHPRLDEAGGKEIFGDIHMLSHQVGAAVRCDLRQLEQHKRESARLRNEVEALRRGITVAQHMHDKAIAALRRELAAAEQRVAHFERCELELAATARNQQHYAALQERASALAARAETLEERNAANARRAARLDLELVDTRAELAAAEEALALALGLSVCDSINDVTGCGKACPAEQALAGRCVLCVGGRAGLVEGYRKLVEVRGGRFLHHDGGQEESLHRIDAAIAAADAVVCQAGCVSHAAYWRMKDACKKLGKPCVFVQSPGVGSFARSLSALANAAPSDQVIRIPG